MILDIVLSLIIVILFLRGIYKGAIYMVFGLAKIIVAILLAPTLKVYIYEYIKDYNLWLSPNVISYILAFVFIVIVVTIVQAIISKFIKITGLKLFDRILGAGVGLLESLVFVVFIIISLLFIKDYNNKISDILYSSKIANTISLNTYKLNDRFPEKIKEKLDNFYYDNKKIELKNRILDKLEIGE